MFSHPLRPVGGGKQEGPVRMETLRGFIKVLDILEREFREMMMMTTL